MQEIIELYNQQYILDPRHLGKLKVYSQNIFQGMMAMVDHAHPNNDKAKIELLRDVDYWNSLKINGTMYDINIFFDRYSMKCEITEMVRVDIDDPCYEFTYESTDNQIVIWECYLVTKLYPNAESGYNLDIVSATPKMYTLHYEYDFDSELAITNGNNHTNGLVRAVKKQSRSPFTW